MSDRDAEHTLNELQEAMSEYRGAFYDEELWLAISPMSRGA